MTDPDPPPCRIVSDGTTTRVYLNGTDISRHVSSVTWDHPTPNEYARATIDLRPGSTAVEVEGIAELRNDEVPW